MKLAFVTIPASLVLAGLGWYMVYSTTRMNEQINLADQPWLKHPVTAQMKKDAESFALKPAHDFRLKDTEGTEHTLASLTGDKPLVIVMVKNGCPCNIDSEPLFNKMYAAHGGRVNFVGVFNEGDVASAKKWKKDTGCPYPVLLDPKLTVANAYKAERSVYTILVNQEGRIEKMWPGYWDKMLVELNSKISALTESPKVAFDPAYAPKIPTSGCSFF